MTDRCNERPFIELELSPLTCRSDRFEGDARADWWDAPPRLEYDGSGGFPSTKEGRESFTIDRWGRIMFRRRPTRASGFDAARGWMAVVLAIGICFGWIDPNESRADDVPFDLEGGERIVFFGDSITQAGGYIADVEVFLLTRFPDRTFAIFNHGISSETISGTSEADHHPRRPDAHSRFTRDVAAWKPDVVVACFGMNDGNYHPFEPERFARYQEGVRRLIDRTRIETHARLVLVTPPPFDAYRRSASDPNAVEYGYKFPAIDYDRTLQEYSRWLLAMTGHERGPLVIDVHGVLDEHLKRRASRPSELLPRRRRRPSRPDRSLADGPDDPPGLAHRRKWPRRASTRR